MPFTILIQRTNPGKFSLNIEHRKISKMLIIHYKYCFSKSVLLGNQLHNISTLLTALLIFVLISPGAMQLTLMLDLPRSAAMAFVNPNIAVLLIEYIPNIYMIHSGLINY